MLGLSFGYRVEKLDNGYLKFIDDKYSYTVSDTSKNININHLVPQTMQHSINFFNNVLVIHASGDIKYLGRIITTDKEIYEALQHVLTTGKPKERR
jgi:hypothetical protein